MKLILQNTSKIVELNGVPARIWEGHTETGIPVHCYITRVAVNIIEDTKQFEEELKVCEPPSVQLEAIPLRMIL